MKKHALRIVIAVLAVTATALWFWARGPRDAHVDFTSPRDDALKILFVGNSHTFVNDLPKTFGSLVLAREPTRPLVVKDVTFGGATLDDHLARGVARRAIESERWDYVVLQEQSMLPSTAKDRYERAVRAFDAIIRRAGAKTVLYAVWPHRVGQDPASLAATYREVAGDVHATLADVGAAWLRAERIDAKVVLYQADGYHPAPAGTYLAACVFYETLVGKSARGLPSLGMVSDDVAAELQRAASGNQD